MTGDKTGHPLPPTTSDLIDICAHVYNNAAIVGGPQKRDGASVIQHPSGVVVICFRGTLVEHDARSVLDWINDLDAELVRVDGFAGKVHRGFCDSLHDLWGNVFEQLEQVQSEPQIAQLVAESSPDSIWAKLWHWASGRNYWISEQNAAKPTQKSLPWHKSVIIVGHSKGGALAQLAGVKLQHLSPQVVTFGSPMVGDLDFAANYPVNVSVVRFENEFDVVPFVPFHELGYSAVREPITQSDLPQHKREVAVLRKLAAALLNHKIATAMAQNHHLTTYRDWINNRSNAAVV